MCSVARPSVYLVQCVRQTGHKLGLHKLRLLVGELRLLLDLESCWLHAKLADLVSRRLQVFQVGRATLNDRAGVCNTAALDLQVRQSLKLVVCQGAGRLRKARHIVLLSYLVRKAWYASSAP